jgi:hypothetical protein
MDDLDERDLSQRLSTLHALIPDVQATQRAWQSARRVATRRKIRRWSIAGVAVAIAAMVVIGIFNFKPDNASAAEALAQTKKATDGYKGWIARKITWSKGAGFVNYYMNTITGQNASASHDHDGRLSEITMFVPDERTQITYQREHSSDFRDGEVRITELWPDSVRFYKKLGNQLGMDAVFQSQPINPRAKVTKSTENGLLRFDINHSQELPAKPRPDAIQSETFWADPQTKLLQRIRKTMFNGIVYEDNYTYGQAIHHDVFDLGVPRTAKVDDLRPNQQVHDVVDHLSRRDPTILGDFVAVVAEENKETQNGVVALKRTIHLCAWRGNQLLAADFLLDETQHNATTHPAALTPKPPTGWPTPSLDDVLPMIQKMVPSRFEISDGKQGWGGDTHFGSMEIRKLDSDEAAAAGKLSMLREIFSGVVPMLSFVDRTPELITAADRPGLVAVKTEQIFSDQSPGPKDLPRPTVVEVYWCDPTRDYVPVEFDSDVLIPPGPSVPPDWKTMEQHYRQVFSNFTLTGNGRWYPSAWTDTDTYPGENRQIVTESHLQLWTGKTLSPEWFADPSTKWSNWPAGNRNTK